MNQRKPIKILASLIVAALFWATLLAGSGLADFRFVFLADSRGDYKEGPNGMINETELKAIRDKIVALNPQPDFVVFGGDMASRIGNAEGDDTFLRRWVEVMSPLTTNPTRPDEIQLYVVKGNHEIYDEAKPPDYRHSNQVLYQQVFKDMPDTYPPGHPNYAKLAYYFEYGEGQEKSLFVVLDSYYMWQVKDKKKTVDKILEGGITDTQLNWLDGLLKNTDAVHKFVFSHMPVFPVSSTLKRDKKSLEALWKNMDLYKVAMFFCGHEHLYDKMILDGSVDKDMKNAVVQVIAGDAGAPFSKYTSVDPAVTRWTVTKKNNYVVVDVKGAAIIYEACGGAKAQGYTRIDSGVVGNSCCGN